jgi:fatty-acyl-CoA synthase
MTERTYVAGQPYEYPLIIKKLLHTAMVNDAGQEIVYRGEQRYSYRDLQDRIHRLAGGLKALGLQPGEVAAVFDYDSPRYLECFFAIPMMGSVLQTVNWRLSTEQIVYTINHAEASVVIVNSDFLPLIEAIKPMLTTVRKFVLIREGESQVSANGFQGEYETMLQSAPACYDFPDLDENTRATTFYTTGTTGDPKGVYFSHRQLVLHSMSLAIAAGSYHNAGRFRSNDVYMPLTPMFHVHAWGVPYVATLLGTKQVYPGRYEPKKILELIQSEKVTFSHCVPTILQMLMTDPLCRETDLSNWKVIIGGAKLSRGQAKAAMDLGITVFTGYGMSETCPIISLSLPKAHMFDWDEEQKLDIITKTGTPIPLVEVEVVDEEDKPKPHDGTTTGEVVFRAPWLTQGYHKSPEKTKELWRNGYLHSGDVGHIDAEGYLQITDRIKDVIKSGGEWVSSLDLENLLSQHEAVLESAAIGIPDAKWGERPLMLAVLKEMFRGQVTEGDLKAYMKQAAEEGRLPKYGVPDNIILLDALPKTSVGKLNKKQMRLDFSGPIL